MPDQDCQFSANSAARRRALRRKYIAWRMALPAAEHAAASLRIIGHLADWLLPHPPGTIAFCAAIRAEVDCQPLVLRLLAAGWQAAMPVVVAPETPMIFRPWTPSAMMTVDPYGIPIPDTPLFADPTVVLLPLVAFDNAGYRLGYGGGYFDRTLAACHPRPLAIGVGFDLCAEETLSPAPHDVPLDAVATESGLRRYNFLAL
jgi:5-formyltetrahydrofolate cyclo-ligase